MGLKVFNGVLTRFVCEFVIGIWKVLILMVEMGVLEGFCVLWKGV